MVNVQLYSNSYVPRSFGLDTHGGAMVVCKAVRFVAGAAIASEA